jgi:hypothetical protein
MVTTINFIKEKLFIYYPYAVFFEEGHYAFEGGILVWIRFESDALAIGDFQVKRALLGSVPVDGKLNSHDTSFRNKLV